MKNRFLIIIFVITLFFTISSCTQKAETPDKTKIKSVIDNFKKFWETEDISLLSRVMAHDSDMVNYGSDANEIFVGWNALKDSIQKILPSMEKTKINVMNRVIKIHSDEKIAWFSQIWDWDFVYNGQPVKLANQRLTGVLEKRDENWVIVQFHNSVPVTQ